MADTTFVNGVTLTDEDWFNDVNRLHYTIFGDPANAGAARTNLSALQSSFGGRITLASGTPVMTTDDTANTTVYFTPYNGDSILIYDGTYMVPTTFAELSQATTDTTKSPAAVTTNSNYDLFVWNDSGTIRCTRGPAWSSDTSRGTGAGTTELEWVKGVLVNKVAITNGPAAQRGTFVGSIRSNGSSQIDWKLGSAAAGGGEAWLGVSNYYNAEEFECVVTDTVDTYTYQSATVRSMNGSNTNRVSVLNCMTRSIQATHKQFLATSASADTPVIAFGLNATNAYATDSTIDYVAGTEGNNAQQWCQAEYRGNLLGWNYLQAVESCVTVVAACTFYGDGGGTTLRTKIFANVRA